MGRRSNVSRIFFELGTGEKPTESSRQGRVLRLLNSYAPHAWRWYLPAVPTSLVGACAQLAVPAAAALAIDGAARGELGWNLLVMAAALAAAALAQLGGGILIARFHAEATASLSCASTNKAMRLGLPGRRPFDHGDLLSRISGDAAAVAGYPATLLSVGTGLLVAGVSVVALLWAHWLFVAALTSILLVTSFMLSRLFASIGQGELEIRALNGRLVNALVGALAGRRTILSAGTLDREIERVTRPLSEMVSRGRIVLELYGRGEAITTGAETAMLIVAAVVGISLMSFQAMTAGTVLAAIRYTQLAFSAINGVLDNGWFHLAIIGARARRVAEVLESQESPAHVVRGGTVAAPAGRVDMHRVVVRGESTDDEVLRDVTLFLPASMTVAIVGASGAGKTTITALIGRLLDPDQGRVSIDGTPVSTLDDVELGRLVAYAFETPALLGHTIRDTLTLGLDASEEEIVAAARAADADSFIRRLPNGYDTPLCDAPLSGGERQRLGLARAALRRSPILVLDDALSSLDTVTEARITSALRSLGTGRTTVIVAHRLRTAANADIVAWLAHGKIRRLAPHGDLWDEEPEYRAAWRHGTDPATGLLRS